MNGPQESLALKERSHRHAQRKGEHLNRIQRRVCPASLNAAHVAASEPALVGKSLLRQALSPPKRLDARTKAHAKWII